MNDLLNTSLSEIVSTNYKAVHIFEKYSLDFCCKGRRTLESACAEKELNSHSILAELESVLIDKPDPSTLLSLSLSDLVDHIVRVHHQYVVNSIPVIKSLLEKVAVRHAGKYSFIPEVERLFLAIAEELETHMNKEEQIVFPMIKDVENGRGNGNSANLKYAITQMEQEHTNAGDQMEQVRNLTNNYEIALGSCNTFGALIRLLKDFEMNLHEHVYLENHVLFPKALLVRQAI